jgi:uncharacterized caspase-like protein
VLRDPERGGFDSVVISVDEDFVTIRRRVSQLFDFCQPDDLVLFFYSGHGIIASDARLYLATQESDFDTPHVCSLAAADIRDRMEHSRSLQQIIVLDCCHSGAFGTKSVKAVTDKTFDSSASARYILTAGDEMEFAWDGPTLKKGDPTARPLSRFTAWIVEGLSTGAAAPHKDRITMDALFRYVRTRAKIEGSPTTPQCHMLRVTGDLVICRNPDAVPGSADDRDMWESDQLKTKTIYDGIRNDAINA